MQLIGGEPTIHPQFWDMLAWLHAEPRVSKIYIATNGIALEKPGVAEKLGPFRDKTLVLLQFDGLEAKTNKALRQANPEKVRMRLLARLDRLDVPMQLTMTLARGVSEREIAWVVSQGVKHRNVRLVAMLPAFFSGRFDIDHDPLDRITLSDVVKGVAAGLSGKTRERGFPADSLQSSELRMGHAVRAALRTVRQHRAPRGSQRRDERGGVQDRARQARNAGHHRHASRGLVATRSARASARKLVRPRDVFGVVVKPFMDRYSYDQDRISACCHHVLDTHGRLESFCEYNARHRAGDSWDRLPQLARRVELAEVETA